MASPISFAEFQPLAVLESLPMAYSYSAYQHDGWGMEPRQLARGMEEAIEPSLSQLASRRTQALSRKSRALQRAGNKPTQYTGLVWYTSKSEMHAAWQAILTKPLAAGAGR
jgi:hypothetical protein